MKILLCLLSLTVSLGRAQTLNPYYPRPLLGPDNPWRLGGATFQTEDSVTAAGLKQQLIRRYHYLEYIKTMYKELKEEYTSGIPGFEGSFDLLGLSSLGLERFGALQRKSKEKKLNPDTASKDDD